MRGKTLTDQLFFDP